MYNTRHTQPHHTTIHTAHILKFEWVVLTDSRLAYLLTSLPCLFLLPSLCLCLPSFCQQIYMYGYKNADKDPANYHNLLASGFYGVPVFMDAFKNKIQFLKDNLLNTRYQPTPTECKYMITAPRPTNINDFNTQLDGYRSIHGRLFFYSPWDSPTISVLESRYKYEDEWLINSKLLPWTRRYLLRYIYGCRNVKNNPLWYFHQLPSDSSSKHVPGFMEVLKKRFQLIQRKLSNVNYQHTPSD